MIATHTNGNVHQLKAYNYITQNSLYDMFRSFSRETFTYDPVLMKAFSTATVLERDGTKYGCPMYAYDGALVLNFDSQNDGCRIFPLGQPNSGTTSNTNNLYGLGADFGHGCPSPCIADSSGPYSADATYDGYGSISIPCQGSDHGSSCNTAVTPTCDFHYAIFVNANQQ